MAANPTMHMSLEDIHDPVLRAKVKKIIPAMPPSATIRHVRDALLSCQGDMSLALDNLFDNPPQKIREGIEVLEDICPSSSSSNQDMETPTQSAGNCDFAESCLNQLRVGSKDGPQKDTNMPNSTTTITHINGAVKSFTISTKSNQTIISDNHTLNKDNIDKTKELEAFNTSGELQPPINIKQEKTNKTFASNEAGESSQTSVKLLYDIFGSRASEWECENALQVCDGNTQEACETLQKSYAFDCDNNDGHNNSKITGCSSLSRQTELKFHVTGSRNQGQKRRLMSPDDYSDKRHKQGSKDRDEESDDPEETEESIQLEPASEWVRKYFPGGRFAVVLLGPGEALRDTIPKKTLCENSSFFSEYYDTMEAEEWEDNTVRLPDIDPQMFDLAMQCMVSKSFTLEPDPIRSKSSEITILLDLVFLAVMLGLPDPTEPVIIKLRDILVDERTALKRKHIRKAFELDEDHGIQELFVKAVVREYMRTSRINTNSEEIDTEDTDDEDGEEQKYRDEAHRSFYCKNRFSFQKEFNVIRGFKLQLLEEQDNVLKLGKKIVVRSATRLRNAIHTIEYSDPLDDEGFFL